MRRFLCAVVALALAGCAGNAGTSAFMQTAIPQSVSGARTDVVQRGDGSAQGYTFLLPQSSYSPHSGIVRGFDGNLWFGTFEQFGRVSERGSFTLFPQVTAYPELSGGISRGPADDRHVWYTVVQMNGGAAAVARVSTPSGETIEYPMPEGVQVLSGIAPGSDDAMYAASYGSNKIVRIPTNGRAISAYDLPGPVPGRPLNIVRGPDDAMWFTMAGGRAIGRFDIKTHHIGYFAIDTPDAGQIVCFEGSIYFLAGYDASNDYVGKMTTSGRRSRIVLPAWNAKARLESMIEGPDGNLWIGGFGSLWNISKRGDVFGPAQLPGITQGPAFLAAGPDGNIWALNNQPASVSVYLLHALTASATSFTLSVGSDAPLTVTESSPAGTIGAISDAPSIATVSKVGPGSFSVLAVGIGQTTIRVSDSNHNFVNIPVTISQ